MLVQDGWAHMRGVTWSSAPAKFKTEVWDENHMVWGFVMYLWEVGSGWVGTNAWCKMESCSGKVQKRDVWDESLRPKDAKFSGGSLGFWFRMGWHKCVVYYGERLPQKNIFWYANVESFGICFANKALVRCGGGSWVGWKGCGWPFSGEVCWFYSLRFFFEHALSTAVFIPCAIFIFNFQHTPETLSFIFCTWIFHLQT